MRGDFAAPSWSKEWGAIVVLADMDLLARNLQAERGRKIVGVMA